VGSSAVKRLPTGLLALIEVGILFLPAIPAYLWVWPNVHGTNETVFQVLVYLYVLAGTVFIGRRRWSWNELGINRNGIWLSLGCTLAFVAARWLIIKGVTWKTMAPTLSTAGLAWNIFYYFALVGMVEELLFRGLIYRALEDWRGGAGHPHAARWAIWGSAFGFMLWHIFGQGPLIGVTTLVIGLAFGAIRWQAGGIVGLIVLHGLWDLESTLLVASDNSIILGQGYPAIASRGLLLLGTALLVLTPLYVWLVHPRVKERLNKRRT
jgi:membrane protease YdiL (CAAX protease family)